MDRVVLKTINGGKIRVGFDKTTRIFSAHKYKKDGSLDGVWSELSQEGILDLLSKYCDQEQEPVYTVVQKAIKIGFDPSTVYAIPKN